MADGAIVLKYLNWCFSDCIQYRDMMFGSRMGFSGTAELMVQPSSFKDPRWWPMVILVIALTLQPIGHTV